MWMQMSQIPHHQGGWFRGQGDGDTLVGRVQDSSLLHPLAGHVEDLVGGQFQMWMDETEVKPDSCNHSDHCSRRSAAFDRRR